MTDVVTQAIEDLSVLESEYAEAEANRVYLQEFRKCKKAMLMKKAEVHHKAIAAQEREAYADPEYAEFLKGLEAATEKALCYKFKIEGLKMRFEAWRTKNANNRARMSSGIGQ